MGRFMHVVAAPGQTPFQRLAIDAVSVHPCYIPYLKRTLLKVDIAFVGYRKWWLIDHVLLLTFLLIRYAIIPPAQ